jgi:hypothetical protein
LYGMQKDSDRTRDCGGAVGGSSWGRKAATQLLTGMLFLGLWQSSAQAISSVTLAWDRNLESDIAGYRIYYGVSSGAYTNVVDAGAALSATTLNLVEGVTYYFAVTAYDSVGLESDYSNEFTYLAAMSLNQVGMRAASDRQTVLTVTSPAGGTFDVQATEDLKIWAVIGTLTLGPGASLDFTDTNAAMFSRRFYRTVKTQP